MLVVLVAVIAAACLAVGLVVGSILLSWFALVLSIAGIVVVIAWLVWRRTRKSSPDETLRDDREATPGEPHAPASEESGCAEPAHEVSLARETGESGRKAAAAGPEVDDSGANEVGDSTRSVGEPESEVDGSTPQPGDLQAQIGDPGPGVGDSVPSTADSAALSGDQVIGQALSATSVEPMVWVLPGRRRFHSQGCRLLAGCQAEEILLAEARDEGFTPCTVCSPDRGTLLLPA